MEANDVGLDWLFTLAKLDRQEGLMYFEPVKTKIDGIEVTDLDPKCFIIDGAKFVYDEDLDKNIIINAVNKVITFNRIDGIQFNVDVNLIEGFPFKVDSFSVMLPTKNVKPTDFVEV